MRGALIRRHFRRQARDDGEEGLRDQVNHGGGDDQRARYMGSRELVRHIAQCEGQGIGDGKRADAEAEQSQIAQIGNIGDHLRRDVGDADQYQNMQISYGHHFPQNVAGISFILQDF